MLENAVELVPQKRGAQVSVSTSIICHIRDLKKSSKESSESISGVSNFIKGSSTG